MPVDFGYGFILTAPGLSRPPRPDYDGYNARFRLYYNPHYLNPGDPVGHKGVDLAAPTGSPVLAVADGKVRLVDLVNNSDAGVYAETLHPEPSGGWYLARYLHFLTGSVLVAAGQLVTKGQQIARVDTTGNAHYPHVHHEIRFSPNLNADRFTVYGASWGVPYDPLDFGILGQPPAPPPVPLVRVTVDRPLLRLGSTGDAVMDLQFMLENRTLYDPEADGNGIDGLFDQQVDVAVRAFQTSKHLIADGIVGTATWTQLLDY